MNGITRDLNKTRLRGDLENIIHEILTEWNVDRYDITKESLEKMVPLAEAREVEYAINIKLTR